MQSSIMKSIRKHWIGVFCALFLTACQPGGGGKSSSFKISRSAFIRNLSSAPSTLNPIRSTDLVASIVQNHILDSLLMRSPNTYKWEPYLAEKWTISPNQKTFTFTLREGAKWHDGRPLTAEDVVFSFQARKDPSYGGAHSMPYYENIAEAKALSPRRVQFKAGKKYFDNLSVLGSMSIIPKHIYQHKGKKLSRSLIGSGPYILKKYNRSKHIILNQNPHWWGRKAKPKLHRIKQVVFKFIPDENDQLLRITAGQLDFLGLSAEAFIKKTSKKPWGETILKRKIRNKSPSGYDYIGWNLKNPLFQNKKVRKALALLMNRSLLNQKFLYSKSSLASGPWYSWSDYADPSVKPVLFDPKTARRLLAEAGWQDTNQNGVLDKTFNGQKKEFRFTLTIANKDSEKYITIYQQDLKKNGIDLSLRFIDWSAFLKLLNEKKFAAVMLGWSGGSVDIDPKQIWHSESAQKGGSNFISYSNPQVDRLINKGRVEMNKQKRIQIFRKVYSLIAQDYPYLFLFNKPVKFYARSLKVQVKKDYYPYSWGLEYWIIP